MKITSSGNLFRSAVQRTGASAAGYGKVTAVGAKYFGKGAHWFAGAGAWTASWAAPVIAIIAVPATAVVAILGIPTLAAAVGIGSRKKRVQGESPDMLADKQDMLRAAYQHGAISEVQNIQAGMGAAPSMMSPDINYKNDFADRLKSERQLGPVGRDGP